jgi:hypothetical protein
MVQPENRQAVAKSPRGRGIPRDIASEPRPKAHARTVDLRVDAALFAGLAVAVHHQVTPRTGLLVEAVIFIFFMRYLVAVMVGAVGDRLLTVKPMLARNGNGGGKLLESKAAVVHLAGPLASLVLAASMPCLLRSSHPAWLATAVDFAWGWGVVGLLPFLPYEGGRVLGAYLGPDRDVAMVLLSIGGAEVASAIAVAALKNPTLGLLFLVAGVVTALRWLRSRRQVLETRVREHIQSARALLDAGSCVAACRVAEEGARTSCQPQTRNEALTVLAWAAVRAGEGAKAVAAVRAIAPREAADPATLAVVDNASGHPERAVATLEHARLGGGLDRAGAHLLIDLHASLGQYDRVTDVALGLARLLGPEDMQRIVEALHATGEADFAARLSPVLAPVTAQAVPSVRGSYPLPTRKRRVPSS